MSRLQSLRILTLVLVAAVSAVDAGSNISRALSTGNLLLKFCTGLYCYAISSPPVMNIKLQQLYTTIANYFNIAQIKKVLQADTIFH